MPELPDVVVYLEALQPRVVGQPLTSVLVKSPFVVRSAEPPLRSAVGKRVLGLRRMGKRLVFELEDGLFLVLHLMIAGRLHWKPKGPVQGGKLLLVAFGFPTGTLTFTEASSRKRASVHLVQGEAALAQLDRGGLEVLEAGLEDFARVLRSESHTLKRALTDPTLFSGIGNAYSDELLHRARLSPLKLTRALDDEEVARLFHATRQTLTEWTERLRRERGEGFPEKVTAFREGMAVHGRYRKPCPTCGQPVQRIAYAENETNYCPTCQNEGRLLADRSLSRLLKDDWPRTAAELEELRAPRSKG